ncbi:PH (Pleckstrin Homology) domain-containing protein [Gelidibacter algens]|uniref:PH (Pleckstrin Homology) domain-containing protein n=1 Tax=Gelidibacter algens TaxID=49280 RepID=A0A327SHS8_9FLAO|nr:PH domain-containing protein [Gelidibacter algens]RAJ25307.1 PH (Pleckstrin Homology) domain-containing protein [Gelidibacter algens]
MEKPLILLPLLIPIILAFWIYFITPYTIKNNKLIYRTGFLRGEIDTSAIVEIIQGKTLRIGIITALSKIGLIIKFNAHDEVYIAAENNKEMISDVLKLNPDIRISGSYLTVSDE